MSLPLLAAARRVARLADPDAGLVARFARDADPAAFAELLARHGPAVWGVCRRAARTAADAEDVFQATFLVLARDAARVRRASSVGSWLFGVAVRLGRAHRRRARTPDPDRLTRPPAADPAAAAAQAELRAALDEELAALPDTLRAPLLLCYYDGLTQDEAAAALGWPARAVKAKVARGRAVLRARLTRRGVELPTALAVPLLAHPSPAPARVTDPLPPAAVAVARGRAPEGVSAAAAALAHSRMAVFAPALRLVACAVVLAVGAAFGAQDHPAVAPPPAAVAPPAPDDDPLPPGAVARMGTTRSRVPLYSHAFFTRDPDQIVVTGKQEPGRVIDVRTGRVVYRLPALPHGLLTEEDADVTPAGDRLAVTGSYRKDRADPWRHAVWLTDLTTRTVLRRLDLPTESRRSAQVRLSADGSRVVTAVSPDVWVWDAGTGKELARTRSDHAHALAVSPDGRTVAFGGGPDLFLWRWETEREPKTFARMPNGRGTDAMRFSPDGSQLVVNDSQQFVEDPRQPVVLTFNTATGLRTDERPVSGSVGGLTFAPDGKRLALYTRGAAPARPGGHVLRLTDPATGQGLRTIPVGRVGLRNVAWSGDGTRVVGAASHRAWVWDARTGRPVGPEAGGHEAAARSLAFAPDGTLFTGSDDQTVRSWDAAGRPGLVLPAPPMTLDLAVSPDGAVVAGLDYQGTVRLWDAASGAELRAFGGGDKAAGWSQRVRFTADGRQLVTWADDLVLRVWDARTGRPVAAHPTRPFPPEGAVPPDWSTRVFMHLGRSGAISPDGSAFAHATEDDVRVLDPATGAVRQTLAVKTGAGVQLAWSPDARRLAVANATGALARDDGTFTPYDLSVWDVAERRKVWSAASAGYPAFRLAFTPDGTRLAQTAAVKVNAGASIRFFDAATGADAGRIALPDLCWGLAFDRTGRRVAVAFDDTTAVVYDTTAARAAP